VVLERARLVDDEAVMPSAPIARARDLYELPRSPRKAVERKR
jgi:hypothetical protein